MSSEFSVNVERGVSAFTKFMLTLFFTLGLCLFASADPLAPGATNQPLTGTTLALQPGLNVPPAAVAYHADLAFSNGSDLSGIFHDTLIQETTGTYDFVFSVDNDATSTLAITFVGWAHFFGFDADVNYLTAPPEFAGVDAASVSRTATGDLVTFNFVNGINANNSVLPGQSSAVHYIRTNATSVDFSGFDVLVGSNASGVVQMPFIGIPAPEPAPVPEPGTLVLLGSGLIGGGLRLRRRFLKA